MDMTLLFLETKTSNTGLFVQLVKTKLSPNILQWGQETSSSVFRYTCEKKKKFFFVQISVFVGDQKQSSELVQLLLDETMAHPEPQNRQTNPSNEMQNSFRRQPATRRRRPYSNPVG